MEPLLNKIYVGLALGLAAAIVDVVPMLLKRLPPLACLSAFIQWVAMGLVITNCDLGLPGWATGMILAVATAVPTILVVIGNRAMVRSGDDGKTAAIMLFMSLLLGGAIGHFSRVITAASAG